MSCEVKCTWGEVSRRVTLHEGEYLPGAIQPDVSAPTVKFPTDTASGEWGKAAARRQGGGGKAALTAATRGAVTTGW